MDLNKVTAGRNPPKEIHAFIEIPLGGVPVKYELDKVVFSWFGKMPDSGHRSL